MSREGKEWWDKFNDIQRYAFFLGKNLEFPSIKATPFSTGNYIEQYEASILVEEMQDEINELKKFNKMMENKLKELGWVLKK